MGQKTYMRLKKNNMVSQKGKPQPVYSDEDQAVFCELAQYVGIGAAIRELGYPTYPTASMWLEKRGVEPKHIDIMEKARLFHSYYKAEDMLKVVDEALNVVQSLYSKIETADDAMKLSNAVSKLINSRQLLEGKASSIVEKRETTQADLEIVELLNAQKAMNKEIKSNITADKSE